MSETAVYTIHTDGAARGNPGPAAFAYIISRDGVPVVEEAGNLGHTTNNVAEYTALVRALERAAQLGANRLLIYSDSELLVKQMNGEYQVKNPDLRVLFQQAKRLAQQFDTVSIKHVRRAQNDKADRLCNEVLDGKSASAPMAATAKHGPSKTSADRQEAVHEEVLTCLQAAAVAWAKGNPADPPPEAVWEQLWSILEEHSVVRRPRSH